MAFSDLIESENMKTTNLDITESSIAFCVHSPCRVIVRGLDVGGAFESIDLEMVELMERPKQESRQPKHTKEEYVKVEFEDVWKYLGLNASGVYQRLSDGGYSKLNHVDDLYTYKGELFTKVETELTEREMVIEQAKEILKCGYCDNDIGKLYDLGMLKPIKGV